MQKESQFIKLVLVHYLNVFSFQFLGLLFVINWIALNENASAPSAIFPRILFWFGQICLKYFQTSNRRTWVCKLSWVQICVGIISRVFHWLKYISLLNFKLEKWLLLSMKILDIIFDKKLVDYVQYQTSETINNFQWQ